MAFYDGLGKKIQKTGQGAIDKTKNMAEVAKLNSTVNSLEKEITATYTDLGKAYFQKYAGSIEDPDFIPYFQKIEDRTNRIGDCKDQISILKGQTKCPQCGAMVDAKAVFCNSCGARLVPEVNYGPGVRICPSCGAVLEEDAAFCTNCGQKYEEPTQQEPVPESAQTFAQEGAPESGKEPVAESEWEEVEIDVTEDESGICEEDVKVYIEEPEFGRLDEQEQQRFCTNCGAPLKEGMRFCMNCGQKVEE